MLKALFVWYVITGVVVPNGDVDGRKMYDIPSERIEYAYKGEVMLWIETKEFKYNEDLTD
jgi:hypothetical protein